MALTKSPYARKLSTCVGEFLSAAFEQLTPNTPLGPSKKGSRTNNARRFSRLDLISVRRRRDTDTEFMVRLIAARLPAPAKSLVSCPAPNPALARRAGGLQAAANLYLVTKHF